MTNLKTRILIPLLIIALLLAYTWIVICSGEVIANWKHYIGLILFAGLVVLFFKSNRKVILATGIYLLLATFNVLAMTPEITTTVIGKEFGSFVISTPPFQLLSLGLLILYFIINMDSLMDIYLDYKEMKNRKRTRD